jgi:uncharacterized protein YegJ (DUF2314 family)
MLASMSFKKFALIVAMFFAMSGSSIAIGREPMISYRAIIYYYPDVADIEKDKVLPFFSGFEIVDAIPEKVTTAVAAVSFEREFKEFYPVPDLKYLSYFGRGLNKEQAESIQQSNLIMIVDIAYPLSKSVEGLKAASLALYNTAMTYDGLIYDSETRELFALQRWSENRLESWDSNIPNAEKHTVIHAYNNGDGIRAITLGMAKFGLPDIVINNFSWSINRSMGNLINLVAQSLVEGNSPSDKGLLKLNIAALKDTQYKKALISSLKDNTESELDIAIADGQWEDGDPENYLIELKFDKVKGDSLSEKHEQLLSALFGWEDEISYVQHNKLLLDASARAKKKLPGLAIDFNKGLAPGEFIHLKAPFKTPDGGNEWMWIDVLSWKGNSISGLLRNEPRNIPELRAGTEVVVDQNDIFDYIRYFPDGSSQGNETGEIIRNYQN